MSEEPIYTIYEYFNHKVLVQNPKQPNRTKIRTTYDQNAEFTGFSYHPIWNEPNRSFIKITFVDSAAKCSFETEFAAADLIELNEEPVMKIYTKDTQ